MFTAFRSIVLCREVRSNKKNGRNDLIDLYSDPIRVNARPGLAMVTIVLAIETDLQRSLGALRVTCAGYDERFDVDMPAGERVVGGALLLQIPVLKAGDLVVTVEQGAGQPSPQARWGLDFRPDAQVMVDADAHQERVLTAAKKAAEIMRAEIPGRRGPWN